MTVESTGIGIPKIGWWILMNSLIDQWYPAPGGWFSNGPLSITESLSCSNYSMEWRSVIIGLALVCSKASPFGWNHDLTTKKWQLKFSKTVKYVGITYITYITLHYITYHTIPYQSFPQLRIRPSSNSGRSLGTHRKVSDTNPPACTPQRRLKRSKSPRARFVEMAWQTQLPGDFRLCKSSWSANCSANRSRKCCIQGNWVQWFKLDCLFKHECQFVMFAKKCFAFGFFGGSYSMVANMLCLPSWPFWNHVCLSNINTDKINKFIALQK